MPDTDAVAPEGDMGAQPEAEDLSYADSTDEFSTSEATEFDASSEAPEAESFAETLFEIDGTPITREEAEKGYLRQSDYTRKTQELANQRRELERALTLQQALDHNPMAALQALQEVYGINQQPDPEWESMDPVERQVVELNQKIEAFEHQQRLAAVDREIEAFSSAHPDVDVNEVMAFAVTNELKNLDQAYRVMSFDDVAAKAAEAEQKKIRTEAKRAAQVVSTDTSKKGATDPPEQYGSFREMAAATFRKHGIDVDL